MSAVVAEVGGWFENFFPC